MFRRGKMTGSKFFYLFDNMVVKICRYMAGITKNCKISEFEQMSRCIQIGREQKIKNHAVSCVCVCVCVCVCKTLSLERDFCAYILTCACIGPAVIIGLNVRLKCYGISKNVYNDMRYNAIDVINHIAIIYYIIVVPCRVSRQPPSSARLPRSSRFAMADFVVDCPGSRVYTTCV